MKHVKRITSFLLALVMVLALGVTAFAEDAATKVGSIAIQNTVKDADYTVYRLFDLESYAGSSESDAHSYKVAAKWSAYFAKDAEGRSYFDVDDNGYVTAKSDLNVVAFAEAALKYATNNSVVDDGTVKGNGKDVTIDNLELGYYLIDSSVGALCALTTTDPNGTVIEKNGNPTLVKQVQEDSKANDEGNGWGNVNDADIGQTVNFKATITVQGLAKSYVMHDKMDDGLTFVSVTGVTLGNTTVETTNYNVKTTDITDDCTFEVVFGEDFCAGLKTGDVIVVSYTATLNSNAVVSEPENNNAHLSYRDNAGAEHETPDSNTQTYTWGMPVLKYANGNKQTFLAGAKFSLYKEEGCTTALKFTEVKSEGQTTAYRIDESGTVTEITTDNTGKFDIIGLDADTYYLKETEAPDGYNKLNAVVKVVIDNEGKITVGDGENQASATTVEVENKSGTELPSTGGVGTTIFYVLGSVLVIGAAVLLITKKRMNAEA